MTYLDELRYRRWGSLIPSEYERTFTVVDSCRKYYGDDNNSNISNSTNTNPHFFQVISQKDFLLYGETHNESIREVKKLLSFSCDYCNTSNVPEVIGLWENGVCEAPGHTAFNIAVYTLYISILLAAVLGNVLVVYVVGGTAKMRTVTNYFIVNLAVGDLCTAIVCIPFTFVTTLILQYWPFGREMCVAVNYLQVSDSQVARQSIVNSAEMVNDN